MGSILKIHTVVGADAILGHSWIEYCPVDGEPKTYGTWGNNPRNAGYGLLENQERDHISTHSRTAYISEEQAAQLFAVIASYRSAGAAAWSLTNPCSAFAAEAWQAATGESLPHRTALVSTPARLASSIEEANRRDERILENKRSPVPRHQNKGMRSKSKSGRSQKLRKSLKP